MCWSITTKIDPEKPRVDKPPVSGLTDMAAQMTPLSPLVGSSYSGRPEGLPPISLKRRQHRDDLWLRAASTNPGLSFETRVLVGLHAQLLN